MARPVVRAVLLHHVYPDPDRRAAVIARAAAAVGADDAVPIIRDRGALTVVYGTPRARGRAPRHAGETRA